MGIASAEPADAKGVDHSAARGEQIVHAESEPIGDDIEVEAGARRMRVDRLVAPPAACRVQRLRDVAEFPACRVGDRPLEIIEAVGGEPFGQHVGDIHAGAQVFDLGETQLAVVVVVLPPVQVQRERQVFERQQRREGADLVLVQVGLVVLAKQRMVLEHALFRRQEQRRAGRPRPVGGELGLDVVVRMALGVGKRADVFVAVAPEVLVVQSGIQERGRVRRQDGAQGVRLELADLLVVALGQLPLVAQDQLAAQGQRIAGVERDVVARQAVGQVVAGRVVDHGPLVLGVVRDVEVEIAEACCCRGVRTGSRCRAGASPAAARRSRSPRST